jgi:uncharacterized membrane protein
MNRYIQTIPKAAEFLGRFFCEHMRAVLRLAVLVLILLVLFAPLLNAIQLDYIAQPIRVVGGAFCHQEPERCLEIAGDPVAVCARCLGGYIGFLLASLLFTPARVGRKLVTRTTAVLAIAGIVDIILHFLALYDTGNAFRLISGLLVGNGIGMIVFGFVSRIEIANKH